MSVFTAADLDSLPAADRVEQVLDLIPNVQMSSGGEGPTIRGQDTTGATRDLPAFLGGTRPRTTLIVDGRPVSFNEFVFGAAPLWDVERVEVFRSPQTTTQGQNSIAGAIFVHTEDPSTSPEYRARIMAGNFDTRHVSAAASGPVTDDIAVRVAGDFRSTRPASVIGKNAVGIDPNRDRYWLVRGRLTATPAAIPGARVDLIYSHTESRMPQVEGVQPPFEQRRNPSASYGTFRVNADAITARLRYDPSARLSLTGLATRGNTDVQRFAPAGFGQTTLAGKDWTAEAVANWSPPIPVRLLAGVSHGRRAFHQYINLSALAGEGRFDDRQEASGLFGEANWSFGTRVLLTAGLRYQRDRQARVGALGSGSAAIPLDYDRTFSAWLPKVSLSYDFTEHLRAGVLVQRAYNPGGVSLRFDTGAADPFEAETLWDYEVFARGRLAGGAVTFSANLFYYDISDAQRSEPIGIVTPNGRLVTFADLFNVPKARSFGFEAEGDWRVGRRLTIRAGAGVLDTKVEAAGEGPAFEGKTFGRAPKFSGFLAAAWRPLDRLTVTAQARRNSGYFSDDLNTRTRRVSGWTTIGGRVEWNAGRFSVFGYARNLGDKFYLTYMFSPNLATAGDPREAGIGLEARF